MHSAPKACLFCLFIPTAGVRHPVLDVDEPLRDLGLPCFLCVFLILLGRSHLASIFFFPWPFSGDAQCRFWQCSIPSSGDSWDLQVQGVCSPALLCCLHPAPTRAVLEEGWGRMRCLRRSEPEGENTLGIIQVLSLGRGVGFSAHGSFLLLRLLSLLGGSGVNL